jgi:hypothetical protein
MIPTWTFPRYAAICGANIGRDATPEAHERRLTEWAKLDLPIIYEGAHTAFPDVAVELRRRRPGIEVGLYRQAMRVPERTRPTPGNLAQDAIRHDPRTRFIEQETPGWPGWRVLDLRDPGTVDVMVEAYNDQTMRLGPDMVLWDEAHRTVRFGAGLEDIDDAQWTAGVKNLLRRCKGGAVNGNFGWPEKDPGEYGPGDTGETWTPMIRGRMWQPFENSANGGNGKIVAAGLNECRATSPKDRHFIVHTFDRSRALEAMVLSLMVDGYSGVTAPDFRQETVPFPLAPGILGRPVEYAEGRAQVPTPDEVPAHGGGTLWRRRFTNGEAWVDSAGDFGVQVYR